MANFYLEPTPEIEKAMITIHIALPSRNVSYRNVIRPVTERLPEYRYACGIILVARPRRGMEL